MHSILSSDDIKLVALSLQHSSFGLVPLRLISSNSLVHPLSLCDWNVRVKGWQTSELCPKLSFAEAFLTWSHRE